MTSTPRKTRAPRVSARPARKTGAAESSGAGAANRVLVRVYRQGLGDCILVRVKRQGQEDYKLLIDCGLVLGVKDKKPAEIMGRIAENLVAETKGAVDAVAVTHEHWDHLSGFSHAGDSFAKLSVGEVWVAWTEDEMDDLANQLRTELSRARTALAACATAFLGTGDSQTPAMLADIATTPLGAKAGGAAAGGASTSGIFKDVKEARIFKNAGDKPPLRFCRPTGNPIEIPGTDARFYVLGPPHDGKLIRKINPSTRTPETYGLALNGNGALSQGVLAALTQVARESTGDHNALDVIDRTLGAAADDGIPDQEAVAPFHPRVTIPLRDRASLDAFEPLDSGGTIKTFFTENYYREKDSWRRIDSDWLGAAPELAMAIQSYTNNTSLVLALEVGPAGQGDVFLFAADAQVGNWESWQNWKWPQDAPKATGPELLARTIFYKVGHHGSHNATLKEHGLEQMTNLKVAVCPVDEGEAQDKHWDRMPLPQLMDALEAKGPKVLALRTDQTPTSAPDFVKVDDLFFEIAL